MRYKFHTGSFAWLIHRATGVVLTLYIFLHLYVLSSLKDPALYVPMLKTLRSPLVRVSEAGLLGIVVGHALNGLRLTLVDLGAPTRLQKALFYAAFLAGSAVFIAGSVTIIRGGK